MRKFLVSIVLLCCISSLQAESLIYSTSFTEWSSQTYTSQQMMSYSGIDFTVSNVKIDPNSKPTSVSSYEGTGYLQPSNGSNLSSCYFQTSKLSSVSRVSYTQAAGTIGCGWRLESSNDGVYFYPFNENETGCTSMKTPETKEVTVYMSDVWLRWTPITTGSTTTSIYLMDINIYGDNGEGGMGGNNSQPAVSIAGSMNGWSTSESTFTPNEDGLSASISMYLAAGSYEFKIVLDNSIWRSLNGTNGDLFTFYRDMTSASNITLEDATNFKLNADVDGEYKFTWTYSDNSLSIVFPEQTGMGDGVTYYLIGNSSELGAWNIANALPMNGGLITVNLPAGSYAIKVLDESKNWDTAMGYLNVNNSCSSSGIAMDEDKNAVFVLEESGSVTVSASDRQICLTGAFKVPDVGQYTNFAALVNHDSTYNCYYAGKAGSGYSQYLAHVRLSEGDTLRIINRADGNSVMQAVLDSYGLTNNFVSGDYNRYHVCVVGGCYDVYYSFENLYIGVGSDCSSGAWYDGAVLPTGWVQLRIKDGQYGNGHVSIDGEGAESYEGKSGLYVLGMELNFEAQPTSSYQFLQWSDNNYANPRPFVVTGDTIIYADFGSLDHYPTGILLNHKKFIRSTYNDGTQLIVRANIQDGDTVELYFLNDNIYWMAELEPYGKYESFSGGVEQGYLVCHETGCYDIYFKMVDGITQTIYIGEGTQCFDGEDWTDPNSTSEKVYSVVGTENLFGKAWDLTDSITVMKPAGDDRYEYNLDSVILVPGGDYQYKVIANHAWNIEEYPSVQEDDNYTITVETPGVYSVLFSLIPGEGCNATTMYMHEIYEEQTPQIVASGECAADGSNNVTWLLTSDSILTIGGSGAMADYNDEMDLAPWYVYKDAYHSVYISSGVTNVGNLAFRQSTNLRYVDLASSVVSLGSYSFYDCPALHVLNLPESVTHVGDNSPFGGSTAITSAIYNSKVFVRLPQDYAGEYTVEEGTTVIASDAFKGCNMLSSVVLPSSVTTLAGSSTFENCSALAAVNIPDGVTTLGMYMFSGCSSLMSIDLPASVTSLGSYCFGECAYIESIICHATTPPEANGSTFAGVNYMIPIYVPQESLEQYPAAEGWSGFTDYRAIDGGSQACTIASGSCGADGDNLMWVLTCDSVLTIYGEGEMPSSYSSNATPWYEHGQAIKHINIEEGVTKLAQNSFYNSGASANYPNVRTLSIPSTLGAPIETSFFYGCPLKTVTILSDTIVGKASYSSNNSLQNKFGAQVEEYIIGGSVRSIANFAFYNQSPDSLQSIFLPEGLEAIGNWAFGYIDHLTSVTIPSTVQTIGTDAFAGCSKLHSVELGEGLMTVNGQAFWMCDNLTQVTCYAMNPPTLNSTSFDHYDTLIVRCEAKSLYQEADYWKNFTPIMCPDDTTGGYVEPDAPEQITFALDSSWKFIMLPTVFGMIQDDIIVDGGEIEWGTYNSEQRAAGLSGWQGFVPSSGFSASRSYIIRARNGSATLTINVPEQAREKAGAAIPFAYNESAHQQNANWNFLGNPYPYSFNIMDALDAQGITSPIAVWNGIGYIMYTPGIDVKILDPFEAFFIQMPTNGTEVLQYSPDYIVGDNGGTNSGYNSVVDEYGALSGYFTINSSKEKVQFSRGNLQYNAAKDMWQFAENQYEIIGEGNANISSAYDGWIDLFGWGTGNNPTKTSTSNCDYSSFVDWGTNAISNGGNTENMWRTLSANEWTYITGQRTNCDSLCGRATVNGIQGFILLPDDWVSPGVPFKGRENQGYELNQYSLEDWQKMEAAGAVFLPACGGRSGTEYSGGGLQYWSTNAGTSCYAYDIITGGASDYKLKTNEIGRQGGYGVRLVK